MNIQVWPCSWALGERASLLRLAVPMRLCLRSGQRCLDILLLLLLTACGATVTPPAPVFLKVEGSTSMKPLLAELAAAYSAQRPHVSFDIQGGGSSLGQTLAEAGQIELGLVSWPPASPAEEVSVTPIARDGVAIILNTQNPSDGISLQELRDIFGGRLLNWREVDGPFMPIQVVSREDGSGTRTAFESIVMGNVEVTPTAIVLPNSQAVVDFVANEPNAIGYVSHSYLREGIYAVPVDGVTPGLESITTNSYALTRDVAILTPKRGQAEIKGFIEFVLSPAGQAIVGKRWGRIK